MIIYVVNTSIESVETNEIKVLATEGLAKITTEIINNGS
jgi:hypothetical protein